MNEEQDNIQSVMQSMEQQPLSKSPAFGIKPKKEPLTPLAIAALVYCAVVVLITGAIVGIKLTRNGSRSSVDPTPATPVVLDPDDSSMDDGSDSEISETSGVTELVPTAELAESVCEKHKGNFMNSTEHVDNSSDYSMYLCIVDTDDGNLIDLTDDFQYTLYVFPDEKLDEYRKEMKNSETFHSESFVVLEDSDELYKGYGKKDLANMQGDKIDAYMYFVMYKNVAIFVEAYDTTSAENILAELGIPNEATEDDRSGI